MNVRYLTTSFGKIDFQQVVSLLLLLIGVFSETCSQGLLLCAQAVQRSGRGRWIVHEPVIQTEI